MAYTFTITEVTPNIGLTVSPAANFTVTNAVNSLSIAETNPQFTVTDVPDNAITINNDGYVFTLTNVDSLVTLTNAPAFVVTATNAVQSFNLTQNTNSFNFSANNITFTATTAIGQIQTENMATIFKGEFTSTDATIYYRGHIVRYNQNIYVATVEPSERVTNPAAPPGNPQWTLIFSQTGLTGWQVESMEKAYNLGPWTAGATYVLNSWVSYNGYIWQLNDLNGTYASEPSLTNPYWGLIGSQGDQALFTTSSVTFRNLTLSGNLSASGGVFSNLTVTNRLTAGGIRYPITNGDYGQVLTTNGENEANWADIGAIVTASIRPATRENLGGVIIGPGLNVTAGGVISVNTGTGGALIGWNLTDNLRTNGFSIETGVPPILSEAFPVPKLEIGSGLRDNMDAALIFDARSTATSVVRLLGDVVRIASGNASVNNTIPYRNEIRVSSTQTELMGTVFLSGAVKIGSTSSNIVLGNTGTNNSNNITIASAVRGGRTSTGGSYFDVLDNIKIAGKLLGGGDNTPVFAAAGIRFADGSIQTSGNTTLPTATTSTLGLVKVPTGSGLTVLSDGSLYLSYSLPTATTSTLGGIKIGAGLAINGSGVVSVTTTSEFVIPPADDTTIGGVKVSTSSTSVLAQGSGLYIDSGNFIRGRIADGSLGMVTIDSTYGISANGAGLLTLNYASPNNIGGVKIDGTTIVMDGSGVISAVGGGTTGTGKTYYAGSGIAINTLSNVISVTTATTSTIGGVVIGDGLQVTSGKTTLKLGGNSLYIDANGALDVISTASSGVFDLSADGYTNGYAIRHSVGSSGTFITVGGSSIAMATPTGVLNLGSQTYMTAGGQAGRLDLGGFTRLRALPDRELVIGSDDTVLRAGFYTKLQLAVDDVQLQANSDAYRLALTRNGADISRPDDASRAKLVLGVAETVLSNNTVVKIQSPDTQFGSNIFNSRIYAGVIYNYSGTGPPLLAEGVQYGDLSVQRTAWPGYDYGQVIKSSAYGPSVPQDFNNPSLAVDFNS